MGIKCKHKWKQTSKIFDNNDNHIENVFTCINCPLEKIEAIQRSEEIPEMESRIFFKEDFHKPEPTICHSDGMITHGQEEYFKKTGRRLYA